MNTETTMNMLYKKRLGTSGISGQLYETKLISLILFRLQHEETIEEFYLASNMDDIGSFDDICLKIKIAGHDRPVVLFIQVKHKDNDDKFLTLDNKNDSVKWSDSILKIKKKITSSKSNDKIFGGGIDDTEYVFILYTNAKCEFDSNNPFVSNYTNNLNRLIATSDTVSSRPLYTEKDVEDFGEKILKEDISLLVERFAKIIGDKANQWMNIMNDEYILRYHVLLRMTIVDVTEIQSDEKKPDVKWRVLKFRQDFFESNDTYVTLFRNHLYDQICKNQARSRKNSEPESPQPETPKREASADELMSSFLSTPTAANLSPLIETQITCNKSGKLEFVTERSQEHIKQLKQMNISKFVIDEAKTIAAKNKLLSLKQNVPISFGNIDLVISGNPKKVARRLNHLTDTITDLCQKSNSVGAHRIVIIDDSIDSGILSPNGGLASAVGNILTYDEETKLLKFTTDETSLENNAKSLYSKLKNKIGELHDYRFDVKAMKFPKLCFDCTDISREFLSKLVIFAKQSNHYEVEELLKNEIRDHHSADPHNFTIKPDSVFLYYHNEVQKWWMSPKSGPYLTKNSNIYTQAINNIVIEPQISALQTTFYMINIRYLGYSFNDLAIASFKQLENVTKAIILTEIITLTTVKVIQCLRHSNLNNKYAVLDLECILNMPAPDFRALVTELNKTEKIVIIVFNNKQNNRTLYIRLNELTQATEEKQVIIITNKTFLDIVKEFFSCEGDAIIDETQSLTAMTEESQKDITKNSKVVFQGQEVSLDLLVDSISIEFIKGAVLNKIIRQETITIGTSLSNSSYEEIKHLYVDRRVSEAPSDLAADEVFEETNFDNIQLVRTFYDIDDDAVLVTAAPGMGKSTLLTHLAIKTKERDAQAWIIRINLLDYSKVFYKWTENKTEIDTLKSLKFMCKVLLKDSNISIRLEEVENKVYLVNCSGDEWAEFELKIFLHLYNKKKLVFLFDGFDEICPHYKQYVMKFFDIVRNYPQKQKMWVTSRPYTEILPDLRKVLGKTFKIEHMADTEQEAYLMNIWREKLIFGELNDIQLQNIMTYMNHVSRMSSTYAPDALHYRFRRIYFIFYDYLKSHFPNTTTSTSKDTTIENNNTDEINDMNSLEETILEKKAPDSFNNTGNIDVDTLLGTPLLLYFVADYFINVIDSSKNITKWQLDLNILSIYEMFIDSKLKKILFQDKNKMDVYNPNIMTKFEKERVDCINMHKRIATYVLLGSPIFSGYNLHELSDMDPLNDGGSLSFEDMIKSLKTGAEKTGLVSHVTADDIPVFIHRTFTEYFAAEFICDIFKSPNYDMDKKKLLYTTTCICHVNDVFPWISKKREIDKDLAYIIREIENRAPLFLSWYRTFFASANWPLEQYIRLMNSSQEDYEGNCFSKANEDYAFYILHRLQQNNRDVHFKKFQRSVIATMKPHLKTYFTSLLETKRPNWLRRAISYNKKNKE